MLGTLCDWLYRKTGSIHPPAFCHWLVVVIWLVFLGGFAQTRPL